MPARQGAITVAMLTVFAAALRVPGLDSGLWFDEIVTLVESVRPPLFEVVTAFPGNNNHPLYSLLAHLSVTAMGEHPWTLRLPAFLFGVAAIPMLYLLGRALTTRVEALLATLLLAVAYHGVWFSQNARGYTMLLLFTLVCTTLVTRLLAAPDLKRAAAYGIVAALGIYTHLTMTFVVAAHALVWAWQIWCSGPAARVGQWKTAITGLGTAGVVAVLLYLPMGGEVYQFFSGPPQETASVATSTWAAAEMVKGLLVGFGWLGLLAALALLAIGGLSYFRRSPLVAAMFVLPGILTGGAMVILHAPVRPRFFFMMAGFGLLILVRGAMTISEFVAKRVSVLSRASLLGEVVVGVMALFSLWSLGFNYRRPKQDFEGARRLLAEARRPDEPVGTSGLARYPFTHYFQDPSTELANADDFVRFRQAADRVWVVYSFPDYMDPSLLAALRTSCPVVRAFAGTLGGGEVVVCTATPAGTAPAQ